MGAFLPTDLVICSLGGTLPHPERKNAHMRALVVWTFLAITFLSLGRTTIKARRHLRRALGRKLRTGEENSLKSWMQVSDDALDAANRELERDPFDRILRFLTTLGFKDDIGTPPKDRVSLR